MNYAVIVFPGSNCDRDMAHALELLPNTTVRFLSCQETSELTDFDAVFLPGGFSYGDYLRTGALAAFTPIIPALKTFAAAGGLIVGICNGFQILTEIGLLPGALVKNRSLKFICKTTPLKIQNLNTYFTCAYKTGEIQIPIAHAEGNYYCDDETYQSLIKNNQIVFTYMNNPNGSKGDIAGIINQQGNVLGMMPHPERAVESLLGNTDGMLFFQSILETIQKRQVTSI